MGSPLASTFALRFSACAHAGGTCLLSVLLSGCVTLYQPLVSLQRPTVIDPQAANFEGLRVELRCILGDALPHGDAELLCLKVGTLLRNQGADVESQVSYDGREAGLQGSARRPDLVVDLKARHLHTEDSTLLWILSWASLTLVPAVTGSSFAQDVSIRDAQGFLLASDTLQARFIRYFGVGFWASNWLLDVLVRPPEEELTGDVAHRDFSRDFYAQLSQLLFNAHIRSHVLRSFEPGPEAGRP